MKLYWNKVSGIIMEGTPAGEQSGLSTLIWKKVREGGNAIKLSKLNIV